MSMYDEDSYYLPGVLFTVDGEVLPANKVQWAMTAPCGCISALHLVTEDTPTETAAWKWLSGTKAQEKEDRRLGCTVRLRKSGTFQFADCPHTPKWGRDPIPQLPDHTWAATDRSRAKHLVPLVANPKAPEHSFRDQWLEPVQGKVKGVCDGTGAYEFEWSTSSLPSTRCHEAIDRQRLHSAVEVAS